MKFFLFQVFSEQICEKKMLSIRLSLALIFCTCFLSDLHSEDKLVTLNMLNTKLEKVCQEVERQTGYFFVYAKNLKKEDQLVSVSVKNVSLKLALQDIFRGLPYIYQIVDRVVVVNTKGAADITEDKKTTENEIVEGVVYSDQGVPLDGVTITIKSSGKSTLSNIKGQFKMYAPSNSVLVISYIGYATQYVIVKDKMPIRVHLLPANNTLDATVVRGYYNTSNRINTGSVSIVKAEDINKQPVTDPLLAIQGRVPGLNIQMSSGLPGSYATVQLRGQNSLVAGVKPLTMNDPLYIIDGVPFSSQTFTTSYIGGGIYGSPTINELAVGEKRNGLSPFNNLNPADIESIEVLKDADATAIYGSRGGNGVILITTKKGRIGRTRMDVNINTGVTALTKRLKLLNTPQYLSIRREAFRNDGINPGDNDYDVNGVWDTTSYTDWQKVMLGKSGVFTNAQLMMSGGNVNTQFSVGGGYSKQGTVLPGNYSDQKAMFNLHLLHTYQRFRVDFSANFVNDNNNMPGTNLMQYVLLPPDAPHVYNSKGELNWAPVGGTATWTNPFAYTGLRSKASTNSIVGSLSIGYQIASGFDFSIRSGYTNGILHQNNITPSTVSPPPYNDAQSRSNAFAESSSNSWIIEPQFNYATLLGKGKFSTLIGGTINGSYSSSFSYIASSFSSDGLIDNPQAAGQFAFRGSNNSTYRYVALFGRLNYNLDDKYIFNFTVRRDGSSRFGPKRQFGNFGALGAAWIFSKEAWVSRSLPLLSYGKIRGSYGITGNDNISDYQYYSIYTPSSPTYQGVATLRPTSIGNPYFQWEKNRKIEVGLELGFNNDNFLLTVNYYRNRTNNQLVGYLLPYTTGFTSVQANLPATLDNFGWEFYLTTKNIKGRKFLWSTTFNMSVPKSILVSYPGLSSSPYFNRYSEGRSVFSLYLYKYAGINPLTGYYGFSSKVGNSFPTYLQDNFWSKPIATLFYGGLQNTFSYKNIQLDFFVQFVKSNRYSYLREFPLPGTYGNQLTEVLKRWAAAGDKSSIQKLSTNTVDNTANAIYSYYMISSDGVICDGSYIRLKNVSLSFLVPFGKRDASSSSSAKIYCQASNLLTITKFVGMDPETGALSMPPARVVTAGVQFSF